MARTETAPQVMEYQLVYADDLVVIDGMEATYDDLGDATAMAAHLSSPGRVVRVRALLTNWTVVDVA